MQGANLFQEVISRTHNKIMAVAKNYFEHVKEMGGEKIPDQPIIFQKPMTSLLTSKDFKLLNNNHEIHHELELGFMVSKKIQNFTKNQDYKEYIAGYFLALDFTNRTLQAKFKKEGFPWDMAKGQDGFCPISKLISPYQIKDPHNLSLRLYINGVVKQNGNTKDMYYKIPDLLEYISTYITLNPGDMILTGTPSGIGPVRAGDKLEGFLGQDGTTIMTLNVDVSQDLQKLSKL